MARRRSRRSYPGGLGLLRSRIWWILGGIILFVLLQLFVFQDEGLLQWYRLKKELRASQTRIKELEAAVEALQRENKRLLDDPKYLERVAREKLRLAKPGEKVYHVIVKKK